MKNKKVLLWAFVLLVPVVITISSCKKFLDRKPLTATLDDLNQGALEGQVLGMYNILRTYGGFSLLPWLDNHSIRDDDAAKGSDRNDGKEINPEYDTYNYTKDDWATNTYYNDHYAMISAANDALYIADSTKASDPASLRNVGEACFFRAYAYWELMKTYGEVPLINFKIKKPKDGLLNKSSLDILYAFVDSNLQIASQLLPLTANDYSATGSDVYRGRLTKGAANTLWAETYLFRQNWSQTIGLCNQVIASGQYSLLPNFPDVWKDGLNGIGKNSAESIFEMNASDGKNAQSNGAVENGSNFGTSQQIRQNGADVSWNLGWGWNVPTQELVDAWDSTDPRKSQTILYSGQSDGGASAGGFGAVIPAYTDPDGAGGLAQKYWNKKLYTGNDPAMRIFTGFANSSGGAPWINHRIFRYAEIILMLAEASNEIGNGAAAAANLELIRKRASGGLDTAGRKILPYIPFIDQAQMRTAIKNERRFELAMEGKRFYDLVRWGDADNVLAHLGYTHRCRYYPIPQQAINLSKVDGVEILKQNPEWP